MCKTLELLVDEDQTYNTQTTDLRHPTSCRSRACTLCAWTKPACAWLEFTQALTHILRIFHSADIGITAIISWTLLFCA